MEEKIGSDATLHAKNGQPERKTFKRRTDERFGANDGNEVGASTRDFVCWEIGNRRTGMKISFVRHCCQGRES